MSRRRKSEQVRRFALKNYQHPDQFGKLLGYRIEKVDRKKMAVQSCLEIREDHLSPAGKVHGGVVSAFFDWACGAAVFTSLGPEDFCSTVEIKVNYLLPLHLGDTLRAKTRVVFRGKRVSVVHGFLFRNRQTAPAAMVTATFNIVSK